MAAVLPVVCGLTCAHCSAWLTMIGHYDCLQSPVALDWEPLALLHQVEQLLEVADLDIQDKALEALHNLLAADASLVPACQAGSLQRRLEAMEAQEGDQVTAPREDGCGQRLSPLQRQLAEY